MVVPMYNEAASIAPTLHALLGQSDRNFFVIFCDNNSTDNTADAVRSVLRESGLQYEIVTEMQKGTGAAADTAVRRAIELGATHIARTDADCLPASDWVAQIKREFALGGVDLVAGYTPPRRDEFSITRSQRVVMAVAFEAARIFGLLRPSNYGKGRHGKYVMCSGNNLAITAEMYDKCGGFPRTRIEEMHEDRGLVNRVRQQAGRVKFRRNVIVQASARRIRAWGLRRSLLWYADHYYKPERVDIRLEDLRS